MPNKKVLKIIEKELGKMSGTKLRKIIEASNVRSVIFPLINNLHPKTWRV